MPRVSGKLIVIMMFSMGILFASGMVFYWYLHTKPFLSLQFALKEHYPGYQISISGGKALKSTGKPQKLRVVYHEMKKSETNIDLGSIAEFVLKIAPEHISILNYDLLEIHLILSGNATAGSHRSFVKSLKPEK